MKVNELMVGDLIKTNSHSWNDETLENKYCKVEMVGQNYLRCSLIDNPKRQPYGEGNSFDPIPLTPEILEKNGFENGKLNVSPQYYLEDNDVFIGVTLKDIPDKHKGIDIAKGRLLFQLEISHIEETLYVHELQHALRLCGIEKEVIL